MFFSHELLADRNSGLAIIWLMATLKSKSAAYFNSKISKAEILKTEIPSACEMIQNPIGPMALRLSSNLLYGVSLVFQHKLMYLSSMY